MDESWDRIELPDGRRLVRDKAHGYLKVMPRPSEAELEAYYARAYQNPCIPHDPEGRADVICEIRPEPGRVCDIGCGNGELLAVFVKRGWQAIGIEPGRQYAQRAREQGIEVIEASLTETLADQLGLFDAVLLAHVLEHLPDPETMLRQVYKLLAPGGLFYCEVPNDFSPLQEVAARIHGLRPWWIALPDHLNYFNISTLGAFIAAQGFEIVTRTTDFPMEMFLLWGDIYVDRPEVGREMHLKRCAFEAAMRQAGQEKLLRDWYVKAAELDIGREAIICARKPGSIGEANRVDRRG